MPTQQDVSDHYTHGGLAAAIRSGIESLGKTINSVTVDDLAPVDEFHIGGRQASEDFLGQLDLSPEKHVLDVGCGLGGAARFVANRYGCRVTGIDLTPEYVETAKVLCRWVGLDNSISLHQGSALAMPFADRAFDRAYMLHVGMNIDDKAKLCSEVSRVLRSNALFGIYDVMKVGDGELTYPVPWATTATSSAVAKPAQYREALEAAGFSVIAERNRRDFALAFFDQLRARTAAADGPPPLGLHILMGRNTPDKVQNMIQNISNGRIAPVELIARKA
ncbi:methyltransferase domain-containing protein [Bradyrhizobium sediminis]|uniref:Methyltransferase domain-containing protein n=1 Tax=Bradyrhizobium sediminis TaxID=2840469 RepID=A0A975RS80_9BRAD|nr:methyltransferase domain-containing protein [Bradyrhizobium sediminis]QWG17653.1 methyltransferase domain-containing protein [Bradyrhizobium sediminis]